jgi:hypothetical protein
MADQPVVGGSEGSISNLFRLTKVPVQLATKAHTSGVKPRAGLSAHWP